MTGSANDESASDMTSHARPLRELRAQRLLTIRDLARLAGVAAAMIYEVEEGTRPPTLRVIRRIAAALEIEPEEIAEFRRRRPPPAEADADQVVARLEAMGYPRALALRVAGRPVDREASPPAE